MFTKLLAATVFLFLGAIAARANVEITAISGTSNLVLSATGGILAQGDLVRLGFFSSTANLGTDNSFSDLNSIFTPIGEGLVGSGTLSQSGNAGNTMDINYASGAGTFSGAFNGVSASYLPTGDQLFLWIFNASDPNTATQWGIFDAPSWIFPSDLGTANLSFSSPNITVFRGSVNGANFDLDAIAAVPEPAPGPLVAGALALGGLCMRRLGRGARPGSL